MKCAKLHLQERTRVRPRSEPRYGKPRRYCQKLLVDPQFEENTQWLNTVQRFCCTDHVNHDLNENKNVPSRHDPSDMFLTVQTLQFKGELTEQNKRPRTSFKYKSMTAGRKHRMFVKQIIDESALQCDIDRGSEPTSYYFDDYSKYFIGNGQSRSPSPKTDIFFHNTDLGNKHRQNKSVQVNLNTRTEVQKERELNAKNIINDVKVADEMTHDSTTSQDIPKVAYHKCGKRKSLTISKADSPETVQVIRVDVVCNYSCSSSAASDYEENKKQFNSQMWQVEVKNSEVSLQRSRYGNKYLLTKSIKALDENVSAGANVTLLCKTFRLARRSKTSADDAPEKIKKSDRL